MHTSEDIAAIADRLDMAITDRTNKRMMILEPIALFDMNLPI